MTCPKCASEFIIEYFPVFTEEMRHSLEKQNYSEEQIQYVTEMWENKQVSTGGVCLKCQHEWTHGHTPEEEQFYAYG